METIKFSKQDFKQTQTGYVLSLNFEDAENKKFGIEALQLDGSYQEVNVLTKAKNNLFEIHEEQPFDGRIIYL